MSDQATRPVGQWTDRDPSKVDDAGSSPAGATIPKHESGFGKTMLSFACAFKGSLPDEEHTKTLAYEIVEAIEMTPVSWVCEHFNGEGVGHTGVLFLIESQVTIDSYSPHFEGGYLWVNSCKAFNATTVMKTLAKRGFVVSCASIRCMVL